MLNYWKDRLEERLAGVDASISKLEEHIERLFVEQENKTRYLLVCVFLYLIYMTKGDFT